jgi:hypothetical protein
MTASTVAGYSTKNPTGLGWTSVIDKVTCKSIHELFPIEVPFQAILDSTSIPPPEVTGGNYTTNEENTLILNYVWQKPENKKPT